MAMYFKSTLQEQAHTAIQTGSLDGPGQRLSVSMTKAKACSDLVIKLCVAGWAKMWGRRIAISLSLVGSWLQANSKSSKILP